MYGFATLFSKYGTSWFEPATIDDQHRLEGYARAVAPPGAAVAFTIEKYNTLEPVAYVTATYTYRKTVAAGAVMRYYDHAFRKLGWEPCAVQEATSIQPSVKTYRNGYNLASLTIPPTASVRHYVIAFSWRIPPGPCYADQSW